MEAAAPLLDANLESKESDKELPGNPKTGDASKMCYDQVDRKLSDRIHRMKLVLPLNLLPAVGALFCSVWIFPFVLGLNFWFCGWWAIVSTIVTLIISEVLKHLTKRARPNCQRYELRFMDFKKTGTKYSMPSGDTAQAAVTATCYFLTYGVDALWACVLVPFVAFGRVYMRAHYLGDTVVGTVLGVLVTLLVHYLCGLIGLGRI